MPHQFLEGCPVLHTGMIIFGVRAVTSKRLKTPDLGNSAERVNNNQSVPVHSCTCAHTQQREREREVCERRCVRGRGASCSEAEELILLLYSLKQTKGVSCQGQNTVSCGIQRVTLHPPVFSLAPPSILTQPAVRCSFGWFRLEVSRSFLRNDPCGSTQSPSVNTSAQGVNRKS